MVRWWWVLLLVVLLAGCGVDDGVRRPLPAGPPREVDALGVLREWDALRSAAWAAGDPAGLSALYVPGSAAGAADVAMLERWVARGLRVDGLAQQVLSVGVRVAEDDRLVLVVTDRLVAPVWVTRGERRWRLPRDRPTTRRLVFLRADAVWRLAVVQEFASDITDPPGRHP